MALFFRPTASGSSFLMERLPAELNIPVIRNRLGFRIRKKNKIKITGLSPDGGGASEQYCSQPPGAEETFVWINICLNPPEM